MTERRPAVEATEATEATEALEATERATFDGGSRGSTAPRTERAAVVDVRGVNKTFGTGSGLVVEALRAVNLSIAQGEFVSLIGPSGCGKSTLLRLIGDLTSPSEGSITVNGKPAHRARLDRDYGIVFQAPVLFEWRTVEKNVQLPLEVSGVSRAERQQRAREMLELVELSAFAGHRPWQLSGGMQQRVAIARALALRPRILLMDEPFGALDEMTRERMNLELLRVWQATGTTIVFVTHSIPEAVFLSTRVVVMSPRPGRITDIVDIDLPPERTVDTRELERYFELVTAVRESLRAQERADDGTDGAGLIAAGDPADEQARRVRVEGIS